MCGIAGGADGHARLVQPPVEIGRQVPHPRLDGRRADLAEEPQRPSEREDAGEQRMTQFKRRRIPGQVQPVVAKGIRVPGASPADHGQHPTGEQGPAHVQHGNTVSRRGPFVPAEDQHVDVLPLHVQRKGGDALRGVDHEDEVMRPAQPPQGRQIVPKPGPVLHRTRDQIAGPWPDGAGKICRGDVPVGRRGQEPHGMRLPQPGQGVGRKLVGRRQHLTVVVEQLCGQVQAERGVGEEGHLVGRRVQEGRHLAPDRRGPFEPVRPPGIALGVGLVIIAPGLAGGTGRENTPAGCVQIRIPLCGGKMAAERLPVDGAHGLAGR